MIQSLFAELKLSSKAARVGVIGAAALACAGLAGATAALASAASRHAEQSADLAAPGARLLTLVNAVPPPLTMPRPATDRLAVLADVPADLSYDADLSGSLDAARIRAVDDAETREAALETAAFERQEAQIQAQIDAAGRDPVAGDAPVVAEAQPVAAADPAVIAAAGDTRPAAE